MYFTHEPPIQQIRNKPVDPKAEPLVAFLKNIDSTEDSRKYTTIDRRYEKCQLSLSPKSDPIYVEGKGHVNAVNSSEIRADDKYSNGLNILSIRRGVNAILLYLIMGTVIFSVWFEGWTFIDAMYFTVVSFTTCGYGDLYPIGNSQRMFGVFFVVIGIIVLGGIYLDVIFEFIFDKYDEARKASKEKLQHNFLNTKMGNIHSQPTESTKVQSTEVRAVLNDLKLVLFSTLPFLGVIILGALFIGYYEGWSVATSVYFCFITATSVGYGDVSPQTQAMRLFSVIYVPFSIGVFAHILASVCGVYINARADKAELEFLSRKMTVDDFKKMDIDENGVVTFDEYVIFMLKVMGKIESSDIQRLRSVFDTLDVNVDRTLYVQDLVAMTACQ